MTMYRARCLFSDSGQLVAVMMDTGRLVGDAVESSGGLKTPVSDDWQTSKHAAWGLAAGQLDEMTRLLQEQADACRQRSVEELLS